MTAVYSRYDIHASILNLLSFETISIFHGCMVWIEKSVKRVTDRHLFDLPHLIFKVELAIK